MNKNYLNILVNVLKIKLHCIQVNAVIKYSESYLLIQKYIDKYNNLLV